MLDVSFRSVRLYDSRRCHKERPSYFLLTSNLPCCIYLERS